MTEMVDVRLIGGWADGRGWAAVPRSWVDAIIEITVPVLGTQREHRGLRTRGELYGYHHKTSCTDTGRPRLEYRVITAPPTGHRLNERSAVPLRLRPSLRLDAETDPTSPHAFMHHLLRVWWSGRAWWATCSGCGWWGGTVPRTPGDPEGWRPLTDRHPEVMA